MNQAANLAFFQNLYLDAALYVATEPAAPEASATEVAPVAPAHAPAPSATPVAAAEPAVAEPANNAAAQAAPVAPTAGKLPSLASLQLPVSTVAPPTSAAPPVPPAVVPPAVPEAERALAVPLLAELPAAPAAPPSQPGRVQPTPTQSPVAHIPFATLGANARGLVILVRLPADEFKKLPRNVFLNNLLKSIRLVMEDVVLVNVEHDKYPVALCSLRQHLAARQFLAFGKNLLDVAVYTTQPYEPVLLYGDTAFLGAGEIKMLEYDAGRKKQLWQSMQRMFLS